MMPHSEAKVKLLHLYLERYLNILSNSKYVGDVHVYDLFCSEGLYDDGGKGSPIVILETISEIQQTFNLTERELGRFFCQFNDIEKWKVEKLQKTVEQNNLKPQNCEIVYTQDDYKNLLQIVVNTTKKFKKEKAFIFIDPYGYKEIRVSDIIQLLEPGCNEVLLFLPTQFMFRFESKGTPESLVSFIEELMPMKEWPESETGIEFIENLTEAFKKAVTDEYYVDSFIITRDKNQFFCLFFFTSHIYGFDRMLDAKWKIDEEEGRGWQFQEENTLFRQIEKTPNTIKFERKLFDYLTSNRSNAEVYEFTLRNSHLPTHATEILLKWQKDGKLIALKKDGSPARKSAFYINYSAYRDEPNKITLQIK